MNCICWSMLFLEFYQSIKLNYIFWSMTCIFWHNIRIFQIDDLHFYWSMISWFDRWLSDYLVNELHLFFHAFSGILIDRLLTFFGRWHLHFFDRRLSDFLFNEFYLLFSAFSGIFIDRLLTFFCHKLPISSVYHPSKVFLKMAVMTFKYYMRMCKFLLAMETLKEYIFLLRLHRFFDMYVRPLRVRMLLESKYMPLLLRKRISLSKACKTPITLLFQTCYIQWALF